MPGIYKISVGLVTLLLQRIRPEVLYAAPTPSLPLPSPFARIFDIVGLRFYLLCFCIVLHSPSPSYLLNIKNLDIISPQMFI